MITKIFVEKLKALWSTPGNSWWGCSARISKFDPYFRPKIVVVHTRFQTRSLFLERPGKFSGPKSNIQIEIKRIRARVLARKLLHFVSSTDSLIMLDAKLL